MKNAKQNEYAVPEVRRKQKKAYALAREMVADQLTVADIEWLVSEHSSGDPRREKLLAACYPGYPEIREGFSRCRDKAGAAAAEIDSFHWQEVDAYAEAGFHLGFAAAMQLCNPNGGVRSKG